MRFRGRSLVVPPLLALALALAIAGCGGGDEETTEAAPVVTTPTATALSKEELIAQGDAICAEVNAAIGGLGESGAEAGGATGQAADLYVGMVESLKRLGAPDEAGGYAEFSSAADELSQAEGEVKLATERGDGAALATAESSAASALASFQSVAQSYGFEACAEGPSAPVPGAPTEETSEEPGGAEEEAAPEEAEAAPETGGAGAGEGGGAEAGGGGAEGGGTEGGGSSGGIGPG